MGWFGASPDACITYPHSEFPNGIAELYHVMFSCSRGKAFLAYSIKKSVMTLVTILYLAISLTCLESKSAFSFC